MPAEAAPRMNLPLSAAQFGIPVVCGVLIEAASELLKHVVHYFCTSIVEEVRLGVWADLRQVDTWIGLAFSIVLVAALV